MTIEDSSYQSKLEMTVARIYVDWAYGMEAGQWKLTRAEEMFPELGGGRRWEFVAECSDNAEAWIGIEVKGLVYAPGERQHNDWMKLIKDVNRELAGKLPGQYHLYRLPKYNFNTRQRQLLVDYLALVIQQVASSLGIEDEQDIGPNIAELFADWPVDKRRQPQVDLKNARLLYPPHELVILKTSIEGESVKGVSPVSGYWGEPTLDQTISDILGKGSANDQLRLAKTKGASKTVLLFDDQIDFDPEIVSRIIREVDPSQLSYIDEVHLVSTLSGQQVQQVYP